MPFGDGDDSMHGNDDVTMGPFFRPSERTAGKEANWTETVPGKCWFAIFRLYGPLDPWFGKTWQPGEIEVVP